MFDSSTWHVVIAARSLCPGSNYQRIVRRASNLLYHLDLHQQRTYWSVLKRVLGEAVGLRWFSAGVKSGTIEIDSDERVF
jgi:hypothetical protein